MDTRLPNGAGTTPEPQDAVSTEPTAPTPAPTLEQVFYDYAPRVYSMARKMVANECDADAHAHGECDRVAQVLGQHGLPLVLQRGPTLAVEHQP